MTVQDARLEAARELFEITPLQPNIGAEITGVDLGQPLDQAVRDGIRAALLRLSRDLLPRPGHDPC